MAKRIAPKNPDTWRQFAPKLFNQYDADPGYYCLAFSDLPHRQKLRAAVAWCSYYHLGIAAKASEYKGEAFYDYLRSLYKTAPRASERRHFRGAAGLTAMESWQSAYPNPEDLASHILGAKPDYFSIARQAGNIRLFGDYFKWKWCDLYEVLSGNPVDFTGSEFRSPKVPQLGAVLIAEDEGNEQKTVVDIYGMIVRHCRVKGMSSPVLPEKPFGIGEAETICCVYKQYRSGGYKYGLRTAKAIARLDSVPSAAGAKMAAALLEVSPWSRKDLSTILENA